MLTKPVLKLLKKVEFNPLFPPQTKTKMGEVMREAAFSLAEAKFTAGDFR